MLSILYFSCKETFPPTDLSSQSVIPLPVQSLPNGETFVLHQDLKIYSGDSSIHCAIYLKNLLNSRYGMETAVVSAKEMANIHLKLTTQVDSLKNEGYLLEISSSIVIIAANQPAGLINGIHTLIQLIPDEQISFNKQPGRWFVPGGMVYDYPVYGYRGIMLDVARHFFSVSEVKQFIDLIALYKINHLHLHLSDDQGWRIEIKSWPGLTEIGGSKEVGGGVGGFYTQDDYREIVNYAAVRNITIVPEIDMPGHTNAALASYPELNCDGKARKLYTGTRVGFSTLCTSSEVVYQFVDDVVREISEMTPGAYFHVGGDESHVTKHEDYIYFLNRTKKIVNSYGKQMMGWEEISYASVDSSDVVQFWYDKKDVLRGVKKGAKAVFSPAPVIYLDMKYDSTTTLGLTWAAYIEVDSSYRWDPLAMVPEFSKVDVLGVEGPLWSETVTNSDEVEFLAFPRAICLAEIGWTPAERRNWNEFKIRLGKQEAFLNRMKVNFYSSKEVPWQKDEFMFDTLNIE